MIISICSSIRKKKLRKSSSFSLALSQLDVFFFISTKRRKKMTDNERKVTFCEIILLVLMKIRFLLFTQSFLGCFSDDAATFSILQFSISHLVVAIRYAMTIRNCFFKLAMKTDGGFFFFSAISFTVLWIIFQNFISSLYCFPLRLFLSRFFFILCFFWRWFP